MPRRMAGQPRPKGVTAVARPIRPERRGTALPGGFKRYGANIKPIIVGGPGAAPSWFLNGNNSPEEWFIWWACRRIYKGPPGSGWLYQTRINAQSPGGIKPDFVLLQTPPVIMRVQSDRHHVQVDSWKAAYDIEQFIALENAGNKVINTYPQYYFWDLSGRMAIQMVREAQNHIQRPDPRYTQTSYARF